MADLRFFVTQEGTLNAGGSGNDTIFSYTGTHSSNTTKGADGNDLISFANQTTAITVDAAVYSAATGEGAVGNSAAMVVAATYGGARESAGQVASDTRTFTTSVASAGFGSVSGTVQALTNTGLTGALNSFVQAGAGNDSIFLGDQLSTFDANSLRGGAGNDAIGTFNSGGTVTGEVTDYSGGEIKGGGGNDTIFLNVSATSASNIKLVGNGGNDTVQFSGTNVELNSGLIGGGSGNDSVVVVADSAKGGNINGGKGDDSISVSLTAASKLTVAGDANTFTGNDTIDLAFAGGYSATSVLGGLGNDSVVVSATTDGGKNLIDAGAGNDTVWFQSAGLDSLSASTVEGGAGNDSIRIDTVSAGVVASALIKGGAGNDTITVDALRIAGSAGFVAGSIKGGAGADSITLSAVSNLGGGSGTFVFTKYNESTLSEMDTLTFNTAAVSADTNSTFASSKIKLDFAAGLNSGVSGAGAVNGKVSGNGGYIVFSGFSDNSLTARVSAINAGFTTTGDFAVFTTNQTDRYLFVQGGATDTVARLSDGDQLSAGLNNIVLSGNTLGFGG